MRQKHKFYESVIDDDINFKITDRTSILFIFTYFANKNNIKIEVKYFLLVERDIGRYQEFRIVISGIRNGSQTVR